MVNQRIMVFGQSYSIVCLCIVHVVVVIKIRCYLITFSNQTYATNISLSRIVNTPYPLISKSLPQKYTALFKTTLLVPPRNMLILMWC
ncbi:hypothetical protein LINGRAHAP2_LOCUS20384 [Linum grandiflorum]